MKFGDWSKELAPSDKLNVIYCSKNSSNQAYFISMSLRIILDNLEDRLYLDDVFYKFQYENSRVVYQTPPLYPLAVRDLDSRDISCTLAHYIENT